jgi:hypothetical protein
MASRTRRPAGGVIPSGTITKGTDRDFDLDQVAEMGRRLWLRVAHAFLEGIAVVHSLLWRFAGGGHR